MIYHSMLMRTRNLFFLFSILLNVVLIFILVARVRNPIIKEISDEQNVDFAQNSTVEKSGEVIGEEIETKEEQAIVAKVIDGDTIVLENGKTLRYIGIDTPEVSQGTECFADESTEKNKELVLGKEVRLEKDVSETDRYGRLLRYVYVANTFINEILVYEGYATAATYPPDVKYSQLFKEAEKDARENSKGLWGKCEESKEGSRRDRSRDTRLHIRAAHRLEPRSAIDCDRGSAHSSRSRADVRCPSALHQRGRLEAPCARTRTGLVRLRSGRSSIAPSDAPRRFDRAGGQRIRRARPARWSSVQTTPSLAEPRDREAVRLPPARGSRQERRATARDSGGAVSLRFCPYSPSPLKVDPTGLRFLNSGGRLVT